MSTPGRAMTSSASSASWATSSGAWDNRKEHVHGRALHPSVAAVLYCHSSPLFSCAWVQLGCYLLKPSEQYIATLTGQMTTMGRPLPDDGDGSDEEVEDHADTHTLISWLCNNPYC